MENKQIGALISMLDVDDEILYANVCRSLLSKTPSVLPFLEDALLVYTDELFQERIHRLIRTIKREDIFSFFQEWKMKENPSLSEALFNLAKIEYPSLDYNLILSKLEELSRRFWLEINEEMSHVEVIKTLNIYFFETCGFFSDRKHPMNASNMFLNTVLTNKKGNDLSLAILYMYIAENNGLPLHFVNLPFNLILSYTMKFKEKSQAKAVDPLYMYINPFLDGLIFFEANLQEHFAQIEYPLKREDKEPCTKQDVFIRYFTSLSAMYGEKGELEKSEFSLRVRDMLREY